VKTKDKNG
jgi:hypothetical protein